MNTQTKVDTRIVYWSVTSL